MKQPFLSRSAAPLLLPACFALSAAGAVLPAFSRSATTHSRNPKVAVPTKAKSKVAPKVAQKSAPKPVKFAPVAAPQVAPKAAPKAAPKVVTLAKYEPERGAYIGAALENSKLRSSAATSRVEQIKTMQRDWETQAGKKHALYLHFIQFPHEDGTFPSWDKDPWKWVSAHELAEATTQNGATPIITLEPMKFEKFYENWVPGRSGYDATEKFARAAGAWGKPLFIRFAHEMNGTWYPWSEWHDKNKNQTRDPGEDTPHTPERYRIAYRNAALMFRKYAPNVALIWCPNSGLLGGPRRDVFRPWYPGDDVVDWVSLDFYERGWTMPMPGAHLWGGQFNYNMTRDMADDKDTPQNESVNFYKTFAQGKNKPMILCETSATLSYRTDLSAEDRKAMTHGWKMGNWGKSEYGWLQSVYGTSSYKAQPLMHPIDVQFPLLKAIVWFQIAKREWIPVEKTENGVARRIYFDNTGADYRIGGGSEENGETPFFDQEMKLYRDLTASDYFLSSLQR